MDITKLTPEQKANLKAELESENRAIKTKRKEDLKTFKQLSGEFVTRHIDNMVSHRSSTDNLIKHLFQDYTSILAIKEEVYGEKASKQDSHTSTLEDGTASITIGYNVSIGFDGTESAGVEKIKGFLTSLSNDEPNVMKLTKAVNTLLKPSAKTQMLKPASIIQLSQLREEFNDAQFDEGLDIIINAQQRRQSSMFVSGWKFIEVDGAPRKLEFRFAI